MGNNEVLSGDEKRRLAELQALDAPLDMGSISKDDRARLAELQAMDAPVQPKPFDLGGTVGAMVASGSNGLTRGYLPQIKAAIDTGHTSGPDYENVKNRVRARLAELRSSNPLASGIAELGSSAPLALIPLPAIQGRLVSAGVGGLLGALEGTGYDVGSPEDLTARKRNGLIGFGTGGILGMLQEGLPAFAERSAERALRPSKIQALKAEADGLRGGPRGNGTSIGRTLLDRGVFDWWPFRGSDKYIPRIESAKKEAGEEIGNVLNTLHDETGGTPVINMNDVAQGVRDDHSFSGNHPSDEFDQAAADRFASSIGRNLKGGFMATLPEAHDIEVRSGARAGFERRRGPNKNPLQETLERSLNRHTSDAIDEAVNTITSKSGWFNPYLQNQWQTANRDYGNLGRALGWSENTAAGDETRHAIGPWFEGVGGGLGAAGSFALGASPTEAAVIAGAGTAAGHLARRYGNAALAYYGDLAGKALNNQGVYRGILYGISDLEGRASQKRSWAENPSPWSNMKTTRD